MSRLLLVSNRLPVTVRFRDGRYTVTPSSGGLATGLKGPHDQLGGLWFGWPGQLPEMSDSAREDLEASLRALRTVPIWLSREELEGYYDGFSNGVLWPTFHYLLDMIPLHSLHWESYRAVNERFADLIASSYRPKDLIWIQDFHLMLLPALLRERLPDATIGFFLHTPFPSYEVFRLLPRRDAILTGVLGSDVIGFHTASYLRHFTTSVVRILGIESRVGGIRIGQREVELGAYPMGVDASAFTRMADDPRIVEESRLLREENRDRKIILGIDRLDYTKGIPRRLLSFENLLEREPELRRHVRLIQIAVPSRTQVEAYESFRRQVDEMVGRINGRFGTLEGSPVHYLFQSFPQRDVVKMYRAADVMLVTPIRDGMNLVAKEFIACRNEENGVLILSEFAGASSQLEEALHVNPYDIEEVGEAIKRAITMPLDEQEARMRRLRDRVAREDVHHWASTFLQALERSQARLVEAGRMWGVTSAARLREVQDRIRREERIALLLDYDGTLVPFHGDPAQAGPDQSLRVLLQRLARRPGACVHIVSGRRREELDEWLGTIPVGLHAEHGLWSRWDPGEDWRRLEGIPMDWKEEVRPILEEFALRTQGAFVEEKESSLVWHYRRADVEYGAIQAKELHLHLMELLSNYPVQILAGEKNIEVRSYGVHKGMIVTRLLERIREPILLVALGDDQTDEDLFGALPTDGIAVHIGRRASRASIRLADPAAARRFLEEILEPDPGRGTA